MHRRPFFRWVKSVATVEPPDPGAPDSVLSDALKDRPGSGGPDSPACKSSELAFSDYDSPQGLDPASRVETRCGGCGPGKRQNGLIASTDSTMLGTTERGTTWVVSDPTFRSEDEACDWLCSNDRWKGKDWRANALSYRLIVGDALDDHKTEIEPEPVLPLPVPSPLFPEKQQFPRKDWGADFSAIHLSGAPEMPTGWPTLLVVGPPPWSRTDAELDYLVRLQAYNHNRHGEIETQALGTAEAIWPVLSIALGSDAKPLVKNKQLQRIVLRNLQTVLFTYKVVFNRIRPWQLERKIKPIFERGHPLHPSHASYPSGHSASAHAMAYLYAAMLPDRSEKLLTAAYRVAVNREFAGLHYPSDTDAGKCLAYQVVNWLLHNRQVAALYRQAKAEL